MRRTRASSETRVRFEIPHRETRRVADLFSLTGHAETAQEILSNGLAALPRNANLSELLTTLTEKPIPAPAKIKTVYTTKRTTGRSLGK
jgi:hypothetical protein